jgi:Tfp pilus assembly protein PilV
MKLLKLQKGMALVEVIAALGIAVVVITSLVSLSLFTLRSSLSSKLQLQGTKVATREAELIRAYRDRSDVPWNDFVSAIRGCYNTNVCCMDSGGSAVQSGECTDGSGIEIVKRSFTVTRLDGTSQLQSGDNAARVNIVATWLVGGANKTTHLYTDLTNWRKSE